MALSEKQTSRIKMCALFGHGKKNITWYSPIKHNAKPDNFIISGMLRRFGNHKSSEGVQVIQFRNNEAAVGSDALIKEFVKQ